MIKDYPANSATSFVCFSGSLAGESLRPKKQWVKFPQFLAAVFLRPKSKMEDFTMNHCIKGNGKRMTALFLVLVLALSMVSTTAFAAQEDNYHDPAEHWLSAINRTNEVCWKQRDMKSEFLT